jgi:hypothetical protein
MSLSGAVYSLIGKSFPFSLYQQGDIQGLGVISTQPFTFYCLAFRPNYNLKELINAIEMYHPYNITVKDKVIPLKHFYCIARLRRLESTRYEKEG